VVLQGEKGAKGQQELKQKLEEFDKAHKEPSKAPQPATSSKTTLNLKQKQIAVSKSSRLTKVIKKHKPATKAPTPVRSKASLKKTFSKPPSKVPKVKAKSAPASKK